MRGTVAKRIRKKVRAHLHITKEYHLYTQLYRQMKAAYRRGEKL